MAFEHERSSRLLRHFFVFLFRHSWRSHGLIGDYFIKAYLICRDYLELLEQNSIVVVPTSNSD